MKANELRIGNYCFQFGNILQVNGHIISALEKAPQGQLWCKPIPLTQEWLLRFGFEHNRAGIWGNNYTLNAVSIQLKGNGIYMFVPHSRCEIKYVNQLQNLYFALTNEELTMK